MYDRIKSGAEEPFWTDYIRSSLTHAQDIVDLIMLADLVLMRMVKTKKKIVMFSSPGPSLDIISRTRNVNCLVYASKVWRSKMTDVELFNRAPFDAWHHGLFSPERCRRDMTHKHFFEGIINQKVVSTLVMMPAWQAIDEAVWEHETAKIHDVETQYFPPELWVEVAQLQHQHL